MSDKTVADDTTITSRQTSGPTETLEQADAPEAAEHRSGVKRQDDTLHHIVVVGGGAAGLELATGLGDKLGKRKRADITLIERSRTHLWKPLLHEVAAGSMNVDNHALDYLAQAHWHHFRYRYGEMIGLDRSKREVCLAATYDDEGNEITPARIVPVRHAGDGGGQHQQRLRNAGRQGVRDPAGYAPPGGTLQQASGQRLHPGPRSTRAGAAGAAPCRDHRGRRHRHRTGGAASPHHPPDRRLRSRPDRPREGLPHHPDRGGGPHPAGAARADLQSDREAPDRSWRRRQGESQGYRSSERRHRAGRWRLHSGRTGGLGRRGQGTGIPAQSRRAGGQPEQPAGRDADARDHPGSQHLRDGRLRVLPARGQQCSRSRRAPRRPISRRRTC